MPHPGSAGDRAAGIVDRIDVDWGGRRVSLELSWVGAGAPLIVFLHEGLGSVAMWRDFPARLCAAVGARGLIYSRPGYGRSTPRAHDERWAPDFMHRQALEVWPALLAALRAREPGMMEGPLWLFGHSDGGSIALLCAADDAGQAGLAGRPSLAGVVVLAPHIMVEDVSLVSIAKARETYAGGGLRARLARYHDHPESAFWGWNDAWLSPMFRSWSIESEIGAIGCPVLAMQGLDDEYGTLEQIRGISRRVPHARLLELPSCGHSPHRDQPGQVIDAVTAFMRDPRVP